MSEHRLLMKIKALIAIFMATLTVLEAHQCYLKRFKNITNGNQALSRSNIISSHNIGRLGECHILCTQKENCHGYNFRFRPSSNNTVNCQLSNSTEKWNSSKIQYGPWVYYQDVVIIEDIDECSLEIDECHKNANCSNTFGSYNCECENGYTGNGRTCEVLPQECSGYTWLKESNRNQKYSRREYNCDNSLSTGWYRFGGGAGTKMPTSCLSIARCGTSATGWMNGAHPTFVQGKVTRKVCYNWDNNCCWRSNNIEVVNCGQYYVYKLSPPPQCNSGYCGSDN